MDFNILSRLGITPAVSPEIPGYAAGSTPAVAPPTAVNPFQALTGGVTPDAAPQAQPTQPARARSSILDVLGRAADVFAQVGGAAPLYQPTLDARQDREIALGDHDRSVTADNLKIQDAQGKIGDADNARLGQAVRGLQAITAANPNADVSKIWPMIAQQAGLDPQRAAALGQQITENPELLKGLAGATGATKEFGLQPFYAKDANGALSAYQLSKDGTIQPVALPDGVAPIDPLKFVDTGGTMTGVGTRGGTVQRILPKTEKPGDAADRASREGIAAGNNRTQLTIADRNNAARIQVAGMPARGKAGGTGKESESAAGNNEVLIALDTLENGFKELHRMNALPGDNGGTVNNVLSAIGRTGAGQYVGEQMGNAAAQKRVALSKTVNTLQQTLIKALPASATRTKFEQEILAKSLPDPSRMSFETATSVINEYRAIFRRAQAAAAKESRSTSTPAAAPRAPSRPPVRPRASGGGKPSVSNW